MKESLLTRILVFSFIQTILSITVVPPTWITSPYVQADSRRVINGDICSCTTGNSFTPSSTMPFTTAFPSIPNLGYGISNYQGNDNLGSEMIEVNRTSLTTSSFSVLVQISGNTNLWVVEVRYIGISKLFPHHLNSFDNVPIQYNNGALVNVTTPSASVKTYKNTINYTLQAQSIGSTYTQFSTPLTNNKILLFLTSFFIEGTNQPSGATTNLNPIDLYVSAVPVSTTTYLLSVNYSKNSALTRLHFSMITFDQADVEASGLYMLVYHKICYPTSGGFYPFESQFLTNFMIGFVEFSSARTASLITFQTNYVTVNGSYGAQMPVSTPRNTSRIPITRFCFSYFYLKTWICPNQTYFDPSSNMCSGCPIINCKDCYNFTVCAICDEANGYFVNASTGQCDRCPIDGCVNCSSPTVCLDCNELNNYILLTNQTCQLCDHTLNQFANSSTQTCDTCTIPNCLNCSSLTECRDCDRNNSFYKTISHQCAFCDPNQNYFIDIATGDCDLCGLANCLNCSSLTQCRQCNQTENYFLNTSNNLCVLCNISYCIQCQNLTTCSICDVNAGYTLNVTSGQCQICLLAGCSNCSTVDICVQCNATANYRMLASNTCELCPNGTLVNVTSGTCQVCTLSNCSECETLTTCRLCDLNNSYYLTANLTCSFCNATNNYFINTSILTCQLCTVNHCLICSNLTNCTLCDQQNNYFYNSTDGLCYACAILGCQECSNLTSCAICNQSSGYVLNSTTNICDLCPVGLFPNTTSQTCQACSVANCTSCITLTTCGACDTNNSFYLSNLSCSYCNSSLNQFINLTTLDCQPCSLLQCTNCSSLDSCSTCNLTANYLLNTTDNLCYQCLIPNCVTCQTFLACMTCNTSDGYFLNTNSGLCQLCNLTGCSNCATLTACQVCDSANGYGLDFTSPNMSLCGACNVSCSCDGYGLPWTSQGCSPICGDGLKRLQEECDDNNTVSNDGCSSTCNIQSYYNCSGEPTVCYKTLFIQSQFVSIQKEGCNGFKITVVTPRFNLSQISNNIDILNEQVTITSAIQNGSYIQISATYTRDIANQSILLNFSPGQLLNITYSPDTPALYYTQSECNVETQVQTMLEASEFISYAILLISIMSCKIVGLQLFGVLQLSYFVLSSHSFLNMYLSPLTKFRTFNGLNIDVTQQNSTLPSIFTKMEVAGSFINNCNIMLLVLFGQLLISFLLFITSKIIRSHKLEKISLRLLKQGFVTVLLFNAFNVSYSAGVHWKYALPTDNFYVLSSVILYTTLAAMLAAVIAMQLTSKQDYGQFKKKYKNVWICQLYVPLTVCYRMVLGFYMAVSSDNIESTLIVMAFSLAFVMYIIINLPFTNVYQNYRCAIIHITMLFTLLTANYYRSMKSTTPMEIKGRIYTPAIIELILMICCLGISFIVLAYEIYQLIKTWSRYKKTSNSAKQRERTITQQSFQHF